MSSGTRFLVFLPLFIIVLLGGACGDDIAPADGGNDAGPDVEIPPMCQRVPDISFPLPSIGMVAGTGRDFWVDLERDWCWDVTISLSTTSDGVISVPSEVSLSSTVSRAPFRIEGQAVGSTEIVAQWEERGEIREARLAVVVTDGSLPTCSGEAMGMLSAGGTIEVMDGSLAGASVALPEGAARDDIYHVDAFDVAVACAEDQVPEGYIALGPAVALSPQHARLMREIPITLPIQLALLPEGRPRNDVVFSYRAPGVAEARVVPGASLWFSGPAGEGGLVHFESPRLGTYQPIVLAEGRATRDRDYSFRGITGFSMGSGGAALVGLHNPERFDFIAPLGGATDWIYLLHYIRTYHLGGFCTESERVMDPTGCAAGALTSRTPAPREIHEIAQDFEHWHYDDGYSGQGGTFDRESYIQIFRDLAMMYGNTNSDASDDPAAPNITAPGIPDSRRMLEDAERCASPAVIPACEGAFPNCAPGTGYVDDEFNSEGQYAAISTCDGREIRIDGERDIGVWDPTATQYFPLEVGLAIDIDGDGLRGPGEPLIRNGHEPFDDCGLDRLCNIDEPAYDPVTNPDPAGDDYDYQFNPRGTEGNHYRDGERCDASGEAFLDAGLDGVIGSVQLSAGGFDNGEGNGCWDMTRGMTRMVDLNPRQMILNADADTLQDLDIFSDGGIRDLFGFAVVHNHFMGSILGRGESLQLFNSHAAFHFSGATLDEDYIFTNVDYRAMGKYVHIRYGDIDASDAMVQQGDGGHVGTGPQVINRLLSALAWMGGRWPNADRERVFDRICVERSSSCPELNQFVFDFTSPTTMRTGPVSIVLPPGYHQEEFADLSYPVVYFLHGYGQEPDDLVSLGIIIWNLMTSRQIPEARRLPKMIFVFPDGRCRGEECIRGTFYADAPPTTPNGAQMETFLLDLMDHVDTNYRTRAPETHPVTE